MRQRQEDKEREREREREKETFKRSGPSSFLEKGEDEKRVRL